MENVFTLILAGITLITGIIWLIKHFKLEKNRRIKNTTLLAQTINDLNNHDQTKIMKKLTNWIEVGSSIFPTLLLVFFIRSFIYEPFQIPSSSMMPTLLVGDFILVKKYAYSIKNPITKKTLFNISNPKRGDIIVFKYPIIPKINYIKRIIGLPGDRVTYDLINKHITIEYSSKDYQHFNKKINITYNNIQSNDIVQLFNYDRFNKVHNYFYHIPLKNNIPKHGIRLYKNKETLNNLSHDILIIPGKQDTILDYYQEFDQPLGTWVVPKGNYFVMGDNRDNSADSRYWGFVSEKNIIGKATIVWMSFEKQEGEWPIGIRFHHIGIIH
ncbi:Signal peptidase I [Candidatus Ecksteinia adelgidicola]|nr:Signal peptidase I [Candidatus Ecksteinia adelgidicola]